MAPRTIAVYLSEHGFGHGMRSGWLLAAWLARHADLELAIATRLPSWLFDRLPRTRTFPPMALPPPLVQRDSLTVDHDASLALLGPTLEHWDEEVTRQARWLRDLRPSLVYCDVPPLPLLAAERAAIPAVALGNFTWDWIYDRYADRSARYAEAARRCRAGHEAATLNLRLPTSPAPPAGWPCVELPWLARTPTRRPDDVRRALGVPPGRPMALLSFGGHPGLPVGELAASPWAAGMHLVAGRQLADAGSAIHGVDEDGLAAQGIGYVDLVAAADVVVSKPGYGILADCLAASSRLVYLSRPEFPEATELLEPAMQRLLGAVAVPPERRTPAGLADAVDEALTRPAPTPSCNLDGVDRAIGELDALLGRCASA